ncbi:MAG: hypothetical protein DI535_24290 [Citrobacter freundii]|nr:MAG: hypothetical protein DI535_24290 [Citrobacter freundii]
MRSIAQWALVIIAACTVPACVTHNEPAEEKNQIAAITLTPIVAADSSVSVAIDGETAASDVFQDAPANNTTLDSAGTPDGKQEPQQKRSTGGSTIVTKENWDRKIIKTADIRAEVKDQQAFYEQLRTKVRELGGYIASEEQKQTDYSIENAVVIKVPVDQFDNALAGLNTGIISLAEKSVRSQDITAEMVDTRSRLETKKRVRQRYSELLGHAKNVEEMFTVEKEISQIQEDIEAAGGRLAYLGHSAAYSTINYTYFQVLNAAKKDNNEPGFISKLKNSFSSGWAWLSGLFLGLVSVWPLWLLIGLLLFILRKKVPRIKPS